MEEEELVAAAASPAPSDHKRKHEDLESEAPQPPAADSHANGNENENENELDSVKRDDGEAGDDVAEAFAGGDADESEAKRPRLEEKPDALVTQNGFQEEKIDEPVEEAVEETAERSAAENNTESEEALQPAEEALETLQPAEEALETLKNELPSSDDHVTGDIRPPSVKNPQLESAQKQLFGGELQELSAEVPQQGDFSSAEEQLASENQTMSRKMEVPNNKVGVLIGKSGDTIRFLQLNSGAKIQITRDADADPYSATRLVELIGTMESVNKAERLIKDVIAEADAGGSPSLVARGFNTVQAAGSAEQILIQVPNEKVGLIIGKGGENIKNLQTRSGARIQLIPQHLPEGDQSKERTVRVSGEKKQIEMAREMIKEVMSQPVRPSSLSGGYNQQVFRPRGPAQQQRGPRGPHPAQLMGYDYQQRGPYPYQNSQYPPQAYGNYAQQQVAPRSSFGSGWEQRPPSAMQGPPPPSGGYDYYGGQGHMVDVPTPVPSAPLPAHGHGPSPSTMGHPPSQGNYNYGQPHGPEYGQPAPYSQTAPLQSYGHGYNETKYEMQAPSHYPYGGHASSQPGGYPQGTHPGYALQDQYGKAPSYAVPPHGPPSQHYGQPRAASQQGDMPYQGAISSTPQPYGQNAPPQQTYPYVSSGPVQQTSYPQYGSASATDGYNQLPPATGSAPVYPQQVGQPVSGYGQPGGQQAPGYVQGGPTGGYGSYPSSQTGYTEQPSQTNAAYGYQGAPDPAYGTAPGSAYGAPTGQAGYAQPPPTQPGYDQSVPHSGGYGSAPVGYGKSLSPQPGYPQYDSTQMYGAHR